MPRLRRSLMTLFSGVGLSATSAVLALVTTPLIVGWLGDARFGAFRATLDWFGYVSLLEFGIAGALTPLFARALATEDRTQVVSVARAGLRAFWPISLLMLLASGGLTLLLPWLLNLPTELKPELLLGGIVLALAALLTPFLTFRPYLEASQRGAALNLLLFGQAVATALLGVLAAGLGTGLGGQLIAFTVGTAFLPICLAWFGFRRYPELLKQPETPSTGSAIWSLSWPTFGFNLCSRVALLTDNIVISAFLGPAAVAPFFLTQRVIALAGAQAQGVANATWAGLIDLYLRGELEAFHHRFMQITRLATLAGFALLGPVAVWNSVLISLWVGAERYAGSGVTWLSAANALMLGIFSVLGWPMLASGKVRVVLPWAILVATVNISTTIILTWQIGLNGPLWGTFVAFTLVNIPATLIQLRLHFQVPPSRIIQAIGRPALVGVLYVVSWIFLRDKLPLLPDDFPRTLRLFAVLGWLGVGVMSFAPLAWQFGLTAAERQEWRGRIRTWRKKEPKRSRNPTDAE